MAYTAIKKLCNGCKMTEFGFALVTSQLSQEMLDSRYRYRYRYTLLRGHQHMGIIQQCFSSPLKGTGRAHVYKDFTMLPALLSTIKCIQKEKNVHLEQFKLPKHIIYLHI